MKILRIKLGSGFEKIIKETAKVIENGGLVIFPSDTVYIAAVDPMNEAAVKKLLEFKNRPTGKAISIAVLDQKMATDFVELSDEAKEIYKSLLPGPFTIVSKGKHKVVSGIEAENRTLGVRIPDNKYINELIKILKKPITATSANISGNSPNYSIQSLLNSLSEYKKNIIDLVVDAGKLPHNLPSTVIDTTESELKILRRGDLISGNAKTLISKSEKETEKVAEFLVKRILKQVQDDNIRDAYNASLQKPIIFGLSGDLGCGKTVFSRQVGKILGIKDKITSPTFVIYNEYEIPLNPPLTKGGNWLEKFLHFDLYRIKDAFEFEEIDFLNLFEPNTVACVEWSENMGEENLKKLKNISHYFPINFAYIDENTREIKYEI
ncbi:MAG: L-threonylcarbamoyladenylate synthase [Candidatus Shapirobacteria bacterium]|nr:L-threonylcarbamoyladenylate synthase [Candidatus Shapirobacteria bacterium]